MKENFNNAQLTVESLADAVEKIKSGFDNATPENIGEMLKDALKITGLAQLLLIDINDLIKSV